MIARLHQMTLSDKSTRAFSQAMGLGLVVFMIAGFQSVMAQPQDRPAYRITKDEMGVVIDVEAAQLAYEAATLEGSVVLRAYLVRPKNMPPQSEIDLHAKEYNKLRNEIVDSLPEDQIIRYSYSASRGFPVFPIRVRPDALLMLLNDARVVEIVVKGRGGSQESSPYEEMIRVDLSGDESRQRRAEAIVAGKFSGEGAIKRFSSVVLDVSVIQEPAVLENQSNAKSGSSGSGYIVISPFPGISYLVQQSSVQTEEHGVTTWRGKINDQEDSYVRLTCGPDGSCLGRIFSDDGRFVISPTKEPPFHIVYEVDREKIKNSTGRQPGTAPEDQELRRKVEEWYKD